MSVYRLPFKTPPACRLVLFLALGVCLPVLGQGYVLTDLNDSGDTYRLAYGINAAGEVVGDYGLTNLLSVGAFWHHDSTNTDLGVLPGHADFVTRLTHHRRRQHDPAGRRQ